MRAVILCFVLIACTLAQPSGADLDALITRIARNHMHGFRDHNLTLSEWVTILETGAPLQVQCGNIAAAARVLIERAGYRVHDVHFDTLEPRNGCDDGHAALTVLHPDHGWVTLDFTTNRMYLQTASEFTRLRGAYVVLANDPLYDNQFAAGWLRDYPGCYTPFMTDLEAWYDRVTQSMRIVN